MAVPMLVLHSFRASPCSSSWVFSVFCVVKVLSDLGILDDDPPFCAVNSLDFPSLPSSTVSLRSILSILYVVTSVHERSEDVYALLPGAVTGPALRRDLLVQPLAPVTSPRLFRRHRFGKTSKKSWVSGMVSAQAPTNLGKLAV